MKFLILTTFVTLGAAWVVVPNAIAIESALTTTTEGSYGQDSIVITKPETSLRDTHSLAITAPPASVPPIEPVTGNWRGENKPVLGQNRLHTRNNDDDENSGTADWVIAISIVLPLIFLFGFVESFFWFSRLMQGRRALRLGTLSWSLLTFFGLFAIKNERAREIQQERMVARANWAKTGLGAKLKLWLKWGFTWEYPVHLLGDREAPGWVWARTNPSTVLEDGILSNDVYAGKSPQGMGKPMEVRGSAYAV